MFIMPAWALTLNLNKIIKAFSWYKMFRFSKRELEVLKLMKDGVPDDENIRQQLGMKDRKQVAVHRSTARKKVAMARRFYQNAMKEYGDILFPGVKKNYKGVKKEPGIS